MAAVYRHRPALVAALDRMARRAADAARSAQGSIGRDCRITDCRLLRDVCIGHGATLEGVSVLSNGTVGNFSRIGIDVKAYDFVTAEHALVDNGSLIERCFIGERCIFDRGYTASDSLFFANSHRATTSSSAAPCIRPSTGAAASSPAAPTSCRRPSKGSIR